MLLLVFCKNWSSDFYNNHITFLFHANTSVMLRMKLHIITLMGILTEDHTMLLILSLKMTDTECFCRKKYIKMQI